MSSIARSAFCAHVHFPRSCCYQRLTLWSKSNLLGTYQTFLSVQFQFISSYPIFFRMCLIVLKFFQNSSDAFSDIVSLFLCLPITFVLMFFQICWCFFRYVYLRSDVYPEPFWILSSAIWCFSRYTLRSDDFPELFKLIWCFSRTFWTLCTDMAYLMLFRICPFSWCLSKPFSHLSDALPDMSATLTFFLELVPVHSMFFWMFRMYFQSYFIAHSMLFWMSSINLEFG